MIGRARRALALLVPALALSAAARGDAALDSYLSAVASQLDTRAAEALARLDGTGRRLLAARSYLRSSASLRDHWSWTQAQIDAYQGSPAQRHLDDEIGRVRQAFEEGNPGFTLYVNPQVRSLDVQIERWNTNTSVSAAAEDLLSAAAALVEAGRFPDAGTPAGRDAFAAFLRSHTPTPIPTIAVPGLSPHGQMRAVDFQVRKGEETIAGPDTTTIETLWLAGGWRDRLSSAVAASGARFVGPLERPDEPWHYNYLGELDLSAGSQ
jgi:hypothetical protein